MNDLDAIWSAIFGQESNYGRNNKTSVTGAVGPGQIQPSTWSQYALPGENINNPSDNITVSKRIVSDYYNRYGGDPERIATAYFSGPGNVSPTGRAYIKDRKDPTGKSVSSYVADISKRLMDNTPDLLGSWAVPQAAEAPTEDLLSSWLPKQQAIPLPQPAPQNIRQPVLPSYDPAMIAATSASAHPFLAGTARGMMDVGDTLASAIAATGEKGANVLERLGIVSPETAAGVADWRKRIGSKIEAGSTAFPQGGTASDLGRITGQVIGTAPFLSPIAGLVGPVAGGGAVANLGRSAIQGAALGTGATALTSASSPESLSDQLTQGAVSGAVLGPAGRIAAGAGGKLAGLVAGSVDPYVAKLAETARNQFGININPMQLAGNNSMMRFMQSMLQRVPFTGFGPATRNQSAQWESALIKEMGQTGDKVTPDLLSKTQKQLSSEYKAINANLGTIPADQPFVSALDTVKNDTDFSRVKNLVDEIKSKIDPATNSINAQDHQNILRTNGPLDKLLNSKDHLVRQDGQSIKAALDDVLQRTDPKLYAARKDVDYKWAVMRSLDEASSSNPTGGVSPQKVFNAFKDYNQGSNARGATKLGQIGAQFLREPQSSGTAERLLSAGLGLGGAGALGALGLHEFDPENFQANLAKGGLGLAGLLALRYGVSPALRSNMLSTLLTQKALGATGSNKLGNLVSRAAIPAAALEFRNSP